MTTLVAGFVLGVAGSLHCIAMCGPLVAVVAPVFGRRSTPAVWYQSGRLGSYVAIGVLAGFAGVAAGAAGFGRGLSVVAGIAMLGMALGQVTSFHSRSGVWWTRQLSRLLGAVARARATHPLASALGAGIVNGVLPCGLVYASAMVAAAAGGPVEGAAVMLAFGLGTAPMMLGIWTGASRLPAGWRLRLRMLTPAALAAVGVLLVLRGVAGAGPHIH